MNDYTPIKILLLISGYLFASWSFGQEYGSREHREQALKGQELRLGVEDSWPPYSNKYGQGISTNIVNAAFAKVGIPIKIEVRAYARVLQDVKAGVLDAGYNVTRQKNTEQDFIFGEEPILQARAYWYFPSGNQDQFQSPQHLPDGYRVGGIIDYEYGDAYEQERHRFKEIRVPRQAQLVRMLQQGRIDAALMFEAEATQTLKNMELPQNSIKKGMLNHISDIYLAFSRKNPHSQAMAKEFDAGLKRLKSTDEYNKLLNAGGETKDVIAQSSNNPSVRSTASNAL